MGQSSRPPSSTASSQRADSPSEVRQHVGGRVHQQEGRSLQQVPVPPDSSPSQVVSEIQDNTPSSASPGGGQQVSRCTIREGINTARTSLESGDRQWSGT